MTRVTRRCFLRNSLASGAALTLAAPFSQAKGANDDIRIAVIGLGELGPPGVGARGRQLIDRVRKVPGCRITALCDIDSKILDREMQRFASWNERVKPYHDMREVFDSPDIDAVVVALPNHWHGLATVWACQAGKDVYVEKPASHSIWEGRQMVAAARKHERIVQVGTQSRSSDISQQAAEFIHSGKLGKPLYAKAVVYRRRSSIGKVTGPQPVPSSVDYNRWLGPAPETPLMRQVFHYDWHWDWATGNGEIGNNGIHYLDRCRWLLGHTGLPRRAVSIGGRFTFDDDGQTPNTQIAMLDYESAPIYCEVRGLTEKPGSNKMDRLREIDKGVIVQCEGGCYVSSTKASVVFDADGKEIKTFTSRIDADQQDIAHQVNFIEAIRSRNTRAVAAEILDGHHSAALCHMANVSHRLGQASNPDAMRDATEGNLQWNAAYERFEQHLAINEIDLTNTPATLGPWVTMDLKTDTFIGEHADAANALSRREYRKGFVMPEIV